MSIYTERSKEYITMIEDALKHYLNDGFTEQSAVREAMSYSISAGGKRIRPVLVLEFCRAAGGSPEAALPFAAALEMIHTYSLIHDDLPCMDDDDFRRGRPSCHNVYGEAEAVLAGDGLLTRAFETAAKAEKVLPASSVIRGISVLARAAGTDGMIGGQVIDLESEKKQLNREELTHLQLLKTGALLKAAAELGCIAASADEKTTEAALSYAEYIGLAFQIRDDILDVTGSQEKLGKPIGSDKENGKATFVSVYGLSGASKKVDELTALAKNALAPIAGADDFLSELADFLAVRDY